MVYCIYVALNEIYIASYSSQNKDKFPIRSSMKIQCELISLTLDLEMHKGDLNLFFIFLFINNNRMHRCIVGKT